MGFDPQSAKKNVFFRKRDGLKYKSEEKKQKLKNYPLYLFEKCRSKNKIESRMNKDTDIAKSADAVSGILSRNHSAFSLQICKDLHSGLTMHVMQHVNS